MEQVFPHELIRIFGLPIRDTVVHTWVLMAVLIVAAYLFRRYSQLRPRGWQVALESVVEFAVSLIEDLIGVRAEKYVSLVGTLALFIASANLLGVFPLLSSPTRDINTTLALAIVVLLAVHYLGIREHSLLGYLKHYAEPNPIVALLNVIGEFSRTLSLTLRLFGNIISSEMIVAGVFMLIPAVAPLPLQVLGMFTGLLQAYVYTILTCTYIRSAVEGSTPANKRNHSRTASAEKEQDRSWNQT